MEQLKRLRVEKGLSQARLAARAEVDPSTVNQIERGAREASPATLRKLAQALDVGLIELLEADSPKDQAPLPLEDAGQTEAERRLARVPEALEDWARSRVEKYEAELEDPNSPHFRTATSATLWLAGLQEERAMWSEWARKWGETLLPPRRGFFDGGGVDSLLGTFKDVFKIMGHLVSFDHGERKARNRIAAMRDEPDALAARRLEQATTSAKESEERLQEWSRAASE